MPYLIHKVNQDDIISLGKLLDAYYRGAWRGSFDSLGRHLSNGAVEIVLAEVARQKGIGFLAWTLTYDLNWCMKGGEVIDFYVSPQYRGHGVALLLVVQAAFEIQGQGGTFLKGGTANPTLLRSCKRFVMCQPDGECYVSGRAFRHLAEMSGKSLRDIVGNLPEMTWNYQP
jgi:GNAT superfamily N-acetyltransferase